MKLTRPRFQHDSLIGFVRNCFEESLDIIDANPSKSQIKFSNNDCLMTALALFTFKSSSLLQFENDLKESGTIRKSLKKIFKLTEVPSDTQLRARLDELNPKLFRHVFKKLFSLLQRAKALNKYKFIDDRYLVSLDGTGYFSSKSVHCKNCCVKEHRDGSKTFYHQTLAGAMVYPGEKVVFPLYNEMIMKKDGILKNDCERNAAKRFIETFKSDHPKLKITLLADGLYANEPFIRLLEANDMQFIIVAKQGDHKYLFDWLNGADDSDAPSFSEDVNKEHHEYQLMHNVPLNSSHECLVNVVRFSKTCLKTKRKTTWVWVTNVPVTFDNVRLFVKGGRARWKIENETLDMLLISDFQK